MPSTSYASYVSWRILACGFGLGTARCHGWHWLTEPKGQKGPCTAPGGFYFVFSSFFKNWAFCVFSNILCFQEIAICSSRFLLKIFQAFCLALSSFDAFPRTLDTWTSLLLRPKFAARSVQRATWHAQRKWIQSISHSPLELFRFLISLCAKCIWKTKLRKVAAPNGLQSWAPGWRGVHRCFAWR